MARVFLFCFFSDRFVDLQRVIVKEFLTWQDIAQRIDEYAVVFLGGFAVWIAGVVDPARVVATDLWVDYLTVIQPKIECMRIVLVVGSGFPGGAFPGVFDNASSLRNELHGINAATVHAGLADLEPCGSLSSFMFLRHGGRKEWEEQLRISQRNGERKKQGGENQQGETEEWEGK